MDMHVTLPSGAIYTLENVLVINFTDGVLTVIYDNDMGIETTTFTQESLRDGGRLTIC